MTGAEIATITDAMTGVAEDAILAGAPVILAVVAGLVGLGVLMRFVRKGVGKKF